MMSKFLDALEKSIITQAVLTVGIWGVILFLYATGKMPPQELSSAGMIILGFYFGSKIGFRQGEKSLQQFVPKRDTDSQKVRL